MSAETDIRIIHTAGGDMHPPGWLVYVAGEVAVVAPLEDALRIARRLARNVSRNPGAPVAITLVDAGRSVRIACDGGAGDPGSDDAPEQPLQPGGAPA
ncbi:MAG TPA: hypothetical protein VFO79_13000 [Xanthomonadales bacterium]|nr:hypothetical protein [Xanthomonadales bacterium]